MAKQRYKVGENPNSLAALDKHRYSDGRPRIYGTPKKQRYLSVTEEGWEGVQQLAREAGCNSVSDLLEKLGRGQINELPRTAEV